MGKAMIRMHVVRLFAEHYTEWKRTFPYASEDGREVLVPVKLLRMAHEIVSENDKLKEEK